LVHRQHHGINSRNGVASSILMEVHPDAPYPDRWLVQGQVLDYVGHGKEPSNQTWDQYNLSLRRALEKKQPVKVIERIATGPSLYIYHGAWHVLEAKETLTESGRTIIRFLLSADTDWRGAEKPALDAAADTPAPPGRIPSTINRIIRDTPLAKRLKLEQNYTCAICGFRQMRGNGDPYAEAHHLHPLGLGGPDVAENMLVLCARHHVDFDYGSIAIDPDDRQTIRHRFESAVNGRVLNRPLPIGSVHYLRYHWAQVFGDT
jgi:hypothetical protein